MNKYGNADSDNENKKKQIYFLFFIIPVLLVISLLFYMIASIDGAMFGTPEDEIDSIISDKMREFIA